MWSSTILRRMSPRPLARGPALPAGKLLPLPSFRFLLDRARPKNMGTRGFGARLVQALQLGVCSGAMSGTPLDHFLRSAQLQRI